MGDLGIGAAIGFGVSILGDVLGGSDDGGFPIEDYRRLQKQLGLREDEAISDVDAAEAKAQGFINDSTEAFVSRLNQASEGAISTLQQLDAQAQEQLQQREEDISQGIIATTLLANDDLRQAFQAAGVTNETAEQNILQGLFDTGLLERQALTDTTMAAIADVSQFSDRAIEFLRPFQEQGERSLLQARVLSGTATAEEIQNFEEKFGSVEASPILRERIAEEERAISRQQQALGKRFSGLGQEEILERGTRKLTGEEFQRQLQTSQNLSQLGLGASSQAAGILQGAGQQIGGLRAGLGQGLASSFARQGQGTAATQTQFGLNRSQLQADLGVRLAENQIRQQQLQAQLQQNFANQSFQGTQALGQNISNVQFGAGQLVAQGQAQAGQNLANIATQAANARSGIRAGTSSNLVSLFGTQAQGAANAAANQASQNAALFGAIGQIGGAVAGTALGGPAGGAVGSQVGGQVGSKLGS
jgi:hypothetical protein